MNLDFQDPFGSAKPKSIERRIDDLFCRCAALSRNGRFLAAGCSDNSIIILDTSMYSRVVELFDEEQLPKSFIKSVSFNVKGNLIAARFEGGEVIIWDALQKKIVSKLGIDPSDKIILAKYSEDDVLVIVKESGKVELLSSMSESQVSFPRVMTEGVIFCAVLSKTRLFLVDNLSILSVIDLRKGENIGSFSESDMGISESSGIISLNCHPERDLLTIVFKNRTIRDPVNKWPWRLSGFSQHEELDSLLIFGTAMTKGKQLIYFWDNLSGSLVQTLEGPKEEVSIALWHPKKPQLITVGAQNGQIFIWGPDFPQKWAALVPNIEAIETNIEYIEREDEFDLPVEEEIKINREIDESVELDFKDFISSTNRPDQDDDRSLYYPIDSY